jgi:hypothetical protein
MTNITNLYASWVHFEFMRNLLFHGFVLFKHKCHALFKSRSQGSCVNNMNKHITFVFKQYEQAYDINV